MHIAEKILKAVHEDDNFQKAKNLAQRRLEGKSLDIKQQEKIAEEFVNFANIIKDFVNRTGPYEGIGE